MLLRLVLNSRAQASLQTWPPKRNGITGMSYCAWPKPASIFLLDFIFVCVCFETECHSVAQGWDAVVQSRLNATSASWVQVIVMPQPPEQLRLQVPATTPSLFLGF